MQLSNGLLQKTSADNYENMSMFGITKRLFKGLEFKLDWSLTDYSLLSNNGQLMHVGVEFMIA